MPLAVAVDMPTDPHFPSVTTHTFLLDQLHQARHLTRELERLLGEMRVSRASESAADLVEAARASNAATRTLLRHASLPVEQGAPERCDVRDGVEYCRGCGMVLGLCCCSAPP